MSLKLIIVDDDPVMLYLHSRLVMDGGLDSAPILFPDAMQTLSYLKHSRHFGIGCLLLLDINMPIMSGWDLLDQIVEKAYTDVHAVMISSSVNTIDHERARAYRQVIGYLEKPLSVSKLLGLTATELFKKIWKINL